MRNFLRTTNRGLTALAAVGRRTCLAAVLATSLTASSDEFAVAQSPQELALSSMVFADTGEEAYGLTSGTPVQSSEGLVTGSGRTVPATLASTPSAVYGGEFYDSGMPVSGDACNPCYAPGCDVTWYLGYEALWLRREGDENFTLSQFNRMPDFDYELGEFGGRITAGRLFDCTNGFEGIYTGPYKWRRTSDVSSNTGTLNSFFSPSGGYTGASIDTFNSAIQHVQTYETKFNTYELNRTWWTWDVLQTLVGIRYVNYEEDYAFFSARSGVGNGNFFSSVNNNAVGPQIGAQLIRPANLRANFGIKGKAAVLANFDDANTFMSNGATVLINSADESVDVAGLVEIGFFGSYQIVPSVRLTAGYEFLYMPRFATVPGQGLTNVNVMTGTSLDNDTDVVLHGGSVGVQVIY